MLDTNKILLNDLVSETSLLTNLEKSLSNEDVLGFKSKYFPNIQQALTLFNELTELKNQQIALNKEKSEIQKRIHEFESLDFIKEYKGENLLISNQKKNEVNEIILLLFSMVVTYFSLYSYFYQQDSLTPIIDPSNLLGLPAICAIFSLFLSPLVFGLFLVFLKYIKKIPPFSNYFKKQKELLDKARENYLEQFLVEINQYTTLLNRQENIKDKSINTYRLINYKDFFSMFHTYDNDFNIQIRDEINIPEKTSVDIKYFQEYIDKIHNIKSKYPNLL